MTQAKSLNINEEIFVCGILGGLDGAKAYRQAYKDTCKSDSSARSGAYRLMHKVEHVVAEIAKRKKELRIKADYDFDKAMEELGKAMNFAKSTKNATALVRAIELRSKLSGLVIDRVDQRKVEGYTLHISGIDDEKLPVIDLTKDEDDIYS